MTKDTSDLGRFRDELETIGTRMVAMQAEIAARPLCREAEMRGYDGCAAHETVMKGFLEKSQWVQKQIDFLSGEGASMEIWSAAAYGRTMSGQPRVFGGDAHVFDQAPSAFGEPGVDPRRLLYHGPSAGGGELPGDPEGPGYGDSLTTRLLSFANWRRTWKAFTANS